MVETLVLVGAVVVLCVVYGAFAAAVKTGHDRSRISQDSLALTEQLLKVVREAEAALPENTGKPDYDTASLRSSLRNLEAWSEQYMAGKK